MSNSKLRVPRLGRTSVFAAVASAAILLAPADGPLGGLLSSAAAQDGAGGQAGGREGGRGQRMQDGGQGGQRGGRGGMGGFGGRGGRMGGMGGGMRDVRELMEPDFMRRDVPLFVSQLELDDTQTLVVETLMGDYESDYATASGRVTEQMAEMGRQMFSNMVTRLHVLMSANTSVVQFVLKLFRIFLQVFSSLWVCNFNCIHQLQCMFCHWPMLHEIIRSRTQSISVIAIDKSGAVISTVAFVCEKLSNGLVGQTFLCILDTVVHTSFFGLPGGSTANFWSDACTTFLT